MTDSAPIADFIHLRVHSAYSLLEGAVQVKTLPALCAQRAMPAVAVTDSGNLFGALEFSETAAKAGIQPIIGCQLALRHAEAPNARERAPDPLPIVLFVQNEIGYNNLMKLNSKAFMESSDDIPHVCMADLARWSQGLICLTGGALGPVGKLLRDGKRAAAEALIGELAALFPERLYVEVQRHGVNDRLRTEAEEASEPGFVEIAYAMNLPLVATNEVFFPDAEMFEAHDALICIAEGSYVSQDERRKLTSEYYFKSSAEMRDRFEDLPEAIDHTMEIARRCAYRPHTRAPILPRFADDEVEELRRQARAGLAGRLETIEMVAPRGEYDQRLEFELGVIEKMGFPGYFLIVADFIKWAKDREIPVGPGRGSGAGSLVAYALTITDLDPLRYGLLFERFLNPERISMPDFDIDFCQDRRDEVIRYVQQRYGGDRVAQIITFGKLQARAALRDVGRVLQIPYGQVDRLCKLVPNNPANPVTLEQAMRDEPRLREEAKREYVVGRLLDIAMKVEGLFRHASTHAAGVVIGDRPLDELVPVYRDPRSDMPVTQFNMKWVEPAGLVKFDFLGLKTLTVIQNALFLLRKRGVEIDIGVIPLDDPKTFDLYARADTVAVFQVESSGMRDALRQLKPTCVEDIIALVSLYRPGPMDNIPRYCNIKHGREEPDYLHPKIEPILKETHGIIIYQEQVMQIAQVLSGYSLGEADVLRRAMGKKIKAEMDQQRGRFVDGAVAQDVPKAKASEIFDLLAKFASYGFNKSHAAAYALVSYQTCWLKANHPVEFMAAVMNLDIHLTDKLAIYKQEVDHQQIELLPPCVNRSEAMFTAEDGKILYALGALKNVGAEAMRLITRARDAGGPFTDLFDLARRVDLKMVGKRGLESLARAGGFDRLDPNRRRVFESIEALIVYGAAMAEAKVSTQASLFGESGEDIPPPRLSANDDWLPTERLSEEYAAVGFYITGHPLDEYRGALRRKRIMTCAELSRSVRGGGFQARVAGAVLGKQERKSARGNRFAFVQLSDPTGLYEVTVFSDVLAQHRDLLEAGSAVVLSVDVEKEGDQLKMLARGVEPIDYAVADAASMGLRVYIGEPRGIESIKVRLAAALEGGGPRRGRGPVNLILSLADAQFEVEMELDGAFPLSPQIRAAIKASPGVTHVEEF